MCIIPPVAERLELAGMHRSFKYDLVLSFVSVLSSVLLLSMNEKRQERFAGGGCVLSLVVLGSKERTSCFASIASVPTHQRSLNLGLSMAARL